MLFAGFGLIALSGTFFLAFWKMTNNNPDARFFVGLVCLGIAGTGCNMIWQLFEATL